MKYSKPVLLALAASVSASTLAMADDDKEIPFDEARLFFELNDTDGDLGIHGKVDGDEWKNLEIEDPYDRKMAKIHVRGRLRRQGLTELFFESAEPTFDELDPQEFFRRFPEGEYDIEGKTLDGEERESEVYVSHIIPAAPVAYAGGLPAASLESCEEEDGAEPIPTIDDAATEGVVISWHSVTMSHAEKWAGSDEKVPLGKIGPVDPRYYEIVMEVDETDLKVTAMVPPDTTEWEFPAAFFEIAEGEDGYAQYKYEVLVRSNVIDADGNPVMVRIDGEESPLPGNKSAIESCFLVPAADGEDED